MSLYKTQRCRYFDDSGHSLKPYCSQGEHCRFIHPNDPQWERVKPRYDMPTDESHEKMRMKARNKAHVVLDSPPARHLRSSPLIPQTDAFRRKCEDTMRFGDSDSHGRPLPLDQRKRDFESWERHMRNREVRYKPSLKRAIDEEIAYPNQRQRKSENALDKSSSKKGGARHHPVGETDHTRGEDQVGPEYADLSVSRATMPDIFCRLAKLCRDIAQDTCILDREEAKLKAFTELSSDLSNAAPTTAMAVTPALAAVITSHAKCKDRVEQRNRELDSLWRSLFSALEDDISKLISSRLHGAIATLHNKRDDILQSLAHTMPLKRKSNELRIVMHGSHESNSRREGRKTYPERSAVSVDTVPALRGSPDQRSHRMSSLSGSLAEPEHENIGANVKEILGALKLQMDKQTRVIELLAKENHKSKYTSQCSPAPSDSCASSRA